VLIRDATLADGRTADVRIDGERIDAVGEGLSADSDDSVIDAGRRLLLPGAIDLHVHFREPGFEHKETWRTGSRAAAAGGVTTVIDQPNTDPATTTGDAFDRKAEIAAADSIVDYGLNGGVTPDWDPDSLLSRPIAALGEVFLADSTGDMGIEEETFVDALDRAAAADVLVTVHAEDATEFDESARERDDPEAWSAYRTAEAEIVAAERACELAVERDVPLHLAHVSTPEAVDAVRAADAAASVPISCEVTPHHLLLSRDDAADLGTFGRMNPPLRSEHRRLELLDRVRDGRVDAIATDHAPHTRAEKDASIWDAPSGVPGVETMLPLLLGELDLGAELVRGLTVAAPARILGLDRNGRIEPGERADLVLLSDDPTPIRGEAMHSTCDWTPFEGLVGRQPVLTTRRGVVVFDRERQAGGSSRASSQGPFPTESGGRNIVPEDRA
jgi:dihydroorotase